MYRGSQARPPRCSAYRAPGALLIADAASRAGRSRSALCHAVCLASSLILRLPSSPFSTLRHPSASPKCFTSHLLPPAASPRPPPTSVSAVISLTASLFRCETSLHSSSSTSISLSVLRRHLWRMWRLVYIYICTKQVQTWGGGGGGCVRVLAPASVDPLSWLPDFMNN